MLEWSQQYNNNTPLRALPLTEKETLKLPREYIANVIYTVIGDPFQAWVNEQVKLRNEKVVDDRDLAIKMDPEIAKIFRDSTAISSKYPSSFYI